MEVNKSWLLHIIFFTLLSSSALSQINSPLIGQEYNTSKKENFSGFIGESTLGLYTADYIYYNKRKQELIIRLFHRGDLSLLSSKDIYHTIDENYTNSVIDIFTA